MFGVLFFFSLFLLGPFLIANLKSRLFSRYLDELLPRLTVVFVYDEIIVTLLL